MRDYEDKETGRNPCQPAFSASAEKKEVLKHKIGYRLLRFEQ